MDKRQIGFTLIELLIVVAIVGILAAVAYPSYVEYINRGKRAEGQAALMKALQLQERFYTVNGTYATNAQLPPLFGLAPGATVRSGQVPSDPNSWYEITVDNPAGCTPITVCVNVTATPRAGFNDPRCGTLTMNSVGQRSQSGNQSVAVCFK